jgi:FkbM family methyltransferase
MIHDINGTKVQIRENTSDDKLIKEVFDTELYNIKKLDVGNSPIILDLGSHIGLFSVRAKQYYPNATIHCYEISKENYDMSLDNLKTFKNVNINNKAVIGNHIYKYYYKDPKYTGGITLNDSEGSSEFDYININDILDKFDKIDIMKIDVEGSEYNIFESITDENLKKIKYILMECHYIKYFKFVPKTKFKSHLQLYRYLLNKDFVFVLKQEFNQGSNIIFGR